MNITELGNAITFALYNNTKLIDCESLLKQYDGIDWSNFVEFVDEKYIKKLVFANDLFDIYVISWNTHQKSCIHDHPDNGCLFKILAGNLTENIYDMDLELVDSKILHKESISYIEGKKSLHNIANDNYDMTAVSLHVYSPPNYKPLFY